MLGCFCLLLSLRRRRLFSETPGNRYSVYTRGNAGEVWPEVVHPLSASLSRREGVDPVLEEHVVQGLGDITLNEGQLAGVDPGQGADIDADHSVDVDVDRGEFDARELMPAEDPPMRVTLLGFTQPQLADPDYDTLPLEHFEPMVREVFARKAYDPGVIRDGEVTGLPPL